MNRSLFRPLPDWVKPARPRFVPTFWSKPPEYTLPAVLQGGYSPPLLLFSILSPNPRTPSPVLRILLPGPGHFFQSEFSPLFRLFPLLQGFVSPLSLFSLNHAARRPTNDFLFALHPRALEFISLRMSFPSVITFWDHVRRVRPPGELHVPFFKVTSLPLLLVPSKELCPP